MKFLLSINGRRFPKKNRLWNMFQCSERTDNIWRSDMLLKINTLQFEGIQMNYFSLKIFAFK